MAKIKLFLKFIFFFFGTLLHESAHYLFALIFGKAEGFSVLPKTEGNRFVFGSVRSRTRYRVLSSFIAAGPLLWWGLLFLILIHVRVVRLTGGMPAIDFGPVLKKLRSFSWGDLFFIWLFLQFLWAGRPSMQDIKNFFRGLLSVSGAVFLAAAAALVYFSEKFF